MNSDFPRIITLLRKEQNLSQKQVALELGVSQALLSHYEKGIRECGLDFVIRIADYYNVSCDYLLGRTPNRNGATIKLDDIPEVNEVEETKSEIKFDNILINKKLIVNSIYLMYEMLSEIDNKGLTTEVSSYMMVSVYKMIRAIYSSNIKNPQAMFSITPELYTGLSCAIQNIVEANAKCLSLGKFSNGFDGVNISSAPLFTPEIISKKYPELAPALYSVIQKAEEKMKKL